MDNKKIRNITKIKLLLITIAFVVICTTALAQPEKMTNNDDNDPNIQKTIAVRYIDPNIAAKVVNEIIQLKIFQLPKETLIVPHRQGKMLTAMAETHGQMKLIEEIVENIDFQIINEGTIDRKYIPVTNLIFDEFYRIISPLLSKEGRLSYNITAHTLVVTEITENLNNIENFVTKLDSYDFVDPNSITDRAVNNAPKQADSNSIEIKAADSNDPMVAVQFSGFKIEQITERLKQWTGKEVVPSQEAMNIRLTVYSPEKMKRSEAIKLLYSAIRYQGFIAEETDDVIYIKFSPFSPRMDILSQDDPLENIPDKDKVVRKIFKLKYSSPSIMGQLILPYLSSSGHFTADDSTKTLLVGDTVKNLIQIEQMIGIFDSDPNALPKGGVITPAIPDDPVIDVNLTNAGINQIIETLTKWTGKAVLPSNEALGLKVTLSSQEKIRQSEALRLLYIEIRKQSFIVEKRNNILYIKPALIGPPYYQILSQDDSLEDIENQDMKARIIFKLKYNSPTKIREILLPLLSPSGNITADEPTNTLYIIDTVKKLKQYKEIIEQFDSESPIPSGSSELSAVKDPNEVIKIINQILNQQADSNSVPKEDVINTNDPNENAQRQESEAVSVKYVDADIGAEKLKELLKEIEIDLTNRLIILPLATSKQILVFGKNEKDRELAESLIHDIDYQAAENSYDFEKISLNHIEPEIFSKLVTNVIEEYRNLKLNLYPVVASKQILLFGGKEYRNVVRKFAEKIDFQTSRLGTEDPNSPSLTTASDIFLKVFEIQNWDSVELAEMLNAIIKNKINEDFTTNLEADPITLIPWPEKHWLIVKASEESITFIAEWIKILESEYPDKIKNLSLSEIKDLNQSEPLVAIQNSGLTINGIKEALTKWTGKKVIASEEAKNLSIIVFAAEKMTQSNAVKLLFAAIRNQGFFVEETEDSIYIKNREDLLNSSPSDVTDFDRIQIIFADMDELIENIIIITEYLDLNRSRNVNIQPLLKLNQILVRGDKKYKDTVKQIVAVIDKPDSQLQRKVFKLKYANAKDVKTKVDELFGGSVISKPENVSADMLITIANPSRNEFIVLTSKDKMKEIEKQVSAWDSPIEVSLLYPRIYTINHVNKEEIINFLSSIFRSNESGDNKSNNTLIQSPVIEMYKNKISFLNLPDSNDILAESYIAEGFLLLDAIINEIDKTEFVPLDKNKAYNKIRENLKTIEESTK